MDGGIDRQTIGDAAQAGANVFVAGSAIYGCKEYSSIIADLKRLAQQAREGAAA
jgi:ribulose-phosphate 3-epimerase